MTRDATIDVAQEQVCPYCANAAYTVVLASSQGTAVRCAGCRLVRTHPYPVVDYRDHEEYGEACAGAGNARLWHSFARELLRFVARYTPGPRLLEVGSGMGYLLAEAPRFGFTAQGLEINRHEVRETRARGLDVREGTLEEAALPANSVDVICMSHTLEHIPDLASTLDEAHRVLRPGGVLAVSQPHYAAPLVRLLGPRWYGWQFGQHIWHFDVPALARILADHRFERVAVAYTSLHHPFLPRPLTLRPKPLLVQLGAGTLARAETRIRRGDQLFLAARARSHSE